MPGQVGMTAMHVPKPHRAIPNRGDRARIPGRGFVMENMSPPRVHSVMDIPANPEVVTMGSA